MAEALKNTSVPICGDPPVGDCRPKSADDLMEITKLMNKCGLDTDKWIRLISSRYKITTLNQFKHLQTGKQQCATLLAAAEKECEKERLNDFFNRLRTYFKSHDVRFSKTKSDSNDPLAVIRTLMRDAGLDPNHWLRFMRSKLNVTELNQFKQFQKGSSQCVKLLNCHLVEHNWHKDALEDFFESLRNYFDRPGDEVDTSKSKDKTDKLAHIKTFIQEKVKSNFVLHPNLLDMSCQETLFENNFQISHVANKTEISRTIQLANQDEYDYYDIFKDYIGVECAGEYLEEIDDSLSNEIKLRKYSNTTEFSGLVFYRLIPDVEFEINTDELKLSPLATQDLQDFDKNLNNDKTCIDKRSHQIIKRFGSHYVRGKMVWGSIFEVIILSQKNESKSFFQKILKEILKYEKSVQQYESKEGFLSVRDILNEVGCKKFQNDDISLCEISINRKSLALQKIIDPQSPEFFDLSTHFIPIWTLLKTVGSLENSDKLEMCLFDEWKSMISKDSSQNKDDSVVNTITHDEMLESFGLQDWYPGKITLNDVMIITESRRSEKIEDIPWMFLQKIIMLDHTARNMELTIPLKSVDIHPLDLLVVVYQCCDPMLQQLLAKQMFLCRMAIPFIVPSKEHLTCCSWPLEGITMEWRSDNDEACEKAFSMHEMHIISCMRYMYGRPAFSKSKFLNDLLSDTSHDVFYHYDGPGGMNPKFLSNGVIEISHFLPSMTNTPFEKELAFINLRGDMKDFVQQAEIICTMSSIVLIIADFTNLSGAFECIDQIMNVKFKNTIVVFVTATSIPSKEQYDTTLTRLSSSIKPYVRIINGFTFKRQKNMHEMKTELRKGLCNEIAATKKKPLALKEWSKQIQDEGKTVEEHGYTFLFSREAQDFDESLTLLDEKDKISETKKALLPLQGELWHKWAELNKSKYQFTRLSGENSGMVIGADHIDSRMKEVRKKQYELINNSAFMNRFIQFLHRNQGNHNVHFALHRLKHYLDGKSRQTLPSLQALYKKTWENVTYCKKDTANVERMVKKLQEIENDIIQSAFGLEHVLREVSQFYEVSFENTAASCGDNDSLWKQLPDIAADLFINGVPLEVMDGDAASVPLLWVKAVLEHTKNKLGDKKVFVLSVIGIQSSGKSTLLNTMFGLEFAVSAGRCTRGIFAQLMPVKNGSKLPFEYLLILDSEGLRAPELANEKHQHDNELATFIIGLADLTLVNLKGENTAEMKDVLQIAVHAFLRMKIVDKTKRQRCVFVHQNVSAVNAKDKLILSQKKLQDQLDVITREAAQAEDPNSDIRSFSEVIEFDGNQDVWYFSDLWHGDPPMAAVNTGYSSNASALRLFLIQKLINGQPRCVSFSDLVIRIQDMWKAILSDDFIFSFRNSLAIKAHISLEQHCAEMKHSIDNELATWRMPVIQRIRKCEAIKKLTETVDTSLNELQMIVNEKCVFVQTDLTSFFETSDFKDILIQWQAQQIETMKRIIEHRGHKLQSELVCLKIERTDILQQTHEFNNSDMLINEAIKLAKSMRGKHTDSHLNSEFDKLWNTMVKPNKTTGQTEKTIMGDIKQALIEEFDNSKNMYIIDELNVVDYCRTYNRYMLNGSVTREDLSENFSDMINEKGITTRLKRLITSAPEKVYDKVINIINGIYHTVDHHLTRISSQNEKFQSLHAQEFARELYAAFNNYNAQQSENTKIVIKTRCIAKFCALAVPLATKKFYEMHTRYEQMYGYEAEMAALKMRIFTLFKKNVSLTSDVCNITELFCDMIDHEVEKTVQNNITKDIQVKLFERIGHTKHSFMLKVMDELCTNKCYFEYKQYIANAHDYCEKWLQNKMIEWSFKQSSKSWYHELADTSIDHLFTHIDISLSKAFQVADEASKEMKIKTLVEVFCKEITPHLEFSESEKKVVTSQNVSDLTQCKKMMLDELTKVKDSMLTKFQTVNERNVQWPERNPCDLVMSELWGCKAQCPFCNEPCQKSEEHVGAHQCIQHRPQGVNGLHWSNTLKLCYEPCTLHICKGTMFSCMGSTCACGNQSVPTDICHEYREYKKYYPDWDIAPDPAGEASVYWKWVMCMFNNDIAGENLKPADLPSQWHTVTQEQARQSLRKFEK